MSIILGHLKRKYSIPVSTHLSMKSSCLKHFIQNSSTPSNIFCAWIALPLVWSPSDHPGNVITWVIGNNPFVELFLRTFLIPFIPISNQVQDLSGSWGKFNFSSRTNFPGHMRVFKDAYQCTVWIFFIRNRALNRRGVKSSCFLCCVFVSIF